MRKALFVFFAFMLALSVNLIATAPAHADFLRYPCQPPGNGIGVDVNIIVDVQGQFCDGPTEINLTHLHCESGGANVNAGAIALAPIGGATLGGIGAQGLGGGGDGCSWRCPDNTIGPQPNPPMMWQRSYIDVRSVIARGKAFCVREGHLAAAGPTSELVDPDEGFPDDAKKPWEQGDPNIPVPHGRPPAPPGPPHEEPGPAGPPPNGPLPVPVPAIPVPPLAGQFPALP